MAINLCGAGGRPYRPCSGRRGAFDGPVFRYFVRHNHSAMESWRVHFGIADRADAVRSVRRIPERSSAGKWRVCRHVRPHDFLNDDFALSHSRDRKKLPGEGRLMRNLLTIVCSVTILVTAAAPSLAECPGNPDAIGTARVITVDPTKQRRIGTMQYPDTLPLKDHEVMLTFDDGPLPPYTNTVLETLAAECVKATFFIVGSMANDSPELVQRVYSEGHTIGTHTQTHAHIAQLSFDEAKQEIEDGIASTKAALSDSQTLAPFFRPPFLEMTPRIANYLASNRIMLWGIDLQADDWLLITADEIVARVLKRIERPRKGVLLLHDIQPPTAKALPKLLKELKQRGYRIVHAVPAGSRQGVA